MSATAPAAAAPTATEVLRLDGLSVPRGGRPVVREVSFEIPPGEVTTLLGANGAGKSTLVLAIAGVLRPSAGRVLLGELDLTRRSPERIRTAGVAVVAEGRRLLPGLTVEDNLRVATYALSREQAKAGIAHTLELFPELEKRWRSQARLLSGGEQQMLVLAQALVSRPKVLLVDELSLGLAPVVVKRLVPTIEAVAASGAGVLLIEQFAQLALSLARTAYVLEGGRLSYSGTAEELRSNPGVLHSAYLAGRAAIERRGRHDRDAVALRAAVTEGRETMRVIDVPEPGEPRAGEVIVRPEAVGLCGSDFHYFLGDLGAVEESLLYPRIQGHEAAGIVEEVGPDCPASVRAGERVAIWPHTSCGHCYPCRIGRGNVCANIRLIGIHQDGALQERLRLPATHVFPVGDQDPAVAALIEPVSIAVRAVVRGRVAPGEKVVVFGAGPIGQAVAAAALDRGAAVLLLDPLRAVSSAAGRSGRTSSPPVRRPMRSRPPASGPAATGPRSSSRRRAWPRWPARAVELVSPAGRVVIVGLGSHDAPLTVGRLAFKEIDVLGRELLQRGRVLRGGRARRPAA